MPDFLFSILGPVKEKFNYLCCLGNNISHLKNQRESLEPTRRDVQMRVEQDTKNGQIIGHQVEAWLEKANRAMAEADQIIKDEDEAKKGCCNGWCSNLKMRYSISEKARKTSQALEELEKKGASYAMFSYPPATQTTPAPQTIDNIHQEDLTTPAPQNIDIIPPEDLTTPAPWTIDIIPQKDFKPFESRMRSMIEIIEALEDDKINMIGIYGMGGIGKTTLVREVVQQLKQDKVFDGVTETVVTQLPDMNKVQNDIAEMLGLKLEAENPLVRADLLRKKLREGKFLVILDDVWEEFDPELEDLGFPLICGNKGCKILFTSRKTSVWGNVQSKKDVQLGLLSEEEAWELFREKAGEHAEDPELLPIAKDIANECGRLPLALVIIASALRTKCRGNNIVTEWTLVLEELRIPCPGNISSKILKFQQRCTSL